MERMWDTPERRRALLCELVGWDSVTGTRGEARFATQLANLVRRVPWFVDHPGNVRVGELPTGTSFVTATYRHPEARDAIVLLSHFDTVDTADYGDFERLAFDPERLTAELAARPGSLPAEAAADLTTGEWLFGRGTMDMKAGLAVHLAVLEQAAAEAWPISIVLLTVPDEEVNSDGMRAATPHLRALAEEHCLCYVLFCNGEPTFPAFPGDTASYVYSGSIGKLLPSVLCFGHETHAGTPLKGLTSSFIAARVTRAMELTDAFRETHNGEVTPLPVTLDQHDRRDGYSTQTPFRTSALYNVFVMQRGADEVLDTFERVVTGAVEQCTTDYHAICEREGVEPIGEIRVLRFDALRAAAVERVGEDEVVRLTAVAAQAGDPDLREQALRIAEALLGACRDLTPAVVLLFAPPYYPAVNSSGDALVEACVARVQEQAAERYGLDVVRAHYFNGISDSSYLSFRSGSGASSAYADNCPGFGTAYDIPFDDMAWLDAPVFNLGPFGKDPHQRTERVHVASAVEQAPELLADLVLTVAHQVRRDT